MDPNFEKCSFLAFLSIELCACSLIFVAFLVIDVSPIINIDITANRVLLKVWLLVKKPGWNGAATGCARRRGWSNKTTSLEDGPP